MSLLFRLSIVACMTVALASNAAAQTQPVKDRVEHLNFDRPEAWALSWFTSTTALSGLDTHVTEPAGTIILGLEATLLPTLSTAQRRVGFNGKAVQDLNKAPVFLRPRVTIGLPGRLSLIAAATPPIRSFDVTPRLFALGVEWAMFDGHDWRVAVRGHGQVGTVTGAFVCPADVLAFPAGSTNNSTGCEAESADVATLRYGGVTLMAARRLGHGITPHAAAGVNVIDGVFQLNAQAFGKLDRTRLETHGTTLTFSTGVAIPLTSRLSLVADALYSPLNVRRTAGAPRTRDSLLTGRTLISYRVH